MEELVRTRPRGSAAAHVAAYSGYASAGVAPAQHRGLSSPWLTVIVTLHEPLRVDAHPDPQQPGGTYDALVGGLHTRPALIGHDGWQSGLQLHLDPLAARAVLGVPAGELAQLDLHADDLLGARVGLLRERLADADTWVGRFAVLDSTISAWLREAPGPPPEVTRAWHRLLASGGAVGVQELARDVGWSARHLGVRFRHETGLSPSTAARVIRFHRARRALQDCPQTRLATLAADHGYYDQAHLSREFRELAGLSPQQWLHAEGIGFVQDSQASQGAGLPHDCTH